MFSSFASILSPALKEKLGITPKKPKSAGTGSSPTSRPLTSSNRTLRALPTALATEVQSPGFSSRLSNYVREEDEDSYVNSPRYSNLGVPIVSLKKKILPKLTSKNSEKVGRRAGRMPVTLRIGPQEPYSPFKRFSCSVERTERSLMVGSREDSPNNSTDPRQVIAALAELSGNNIVLTNPFNLFLCRQEIKTSL